MYFQMTCLGLVLLLWHQATAQDHANCDAVHYRNVSVSGIFLGATEKNLVKMLGTPDTMRIKQNEFEGMTYFEYKYGTSTFQISGNVFCGFRLRDASFQLDNANVKVGDTVNKLRESFPLSFKNRYRNGNATVVKVRIDATDAYILFHCVKDTIDEISTWDDL